MGWNCPVRCLVVLMLLGFDDLLLLCALSLYQSLIYKQKAFPVSLTALSDHLYSTQCIYLLLSLSM